MTQAEAEVYAAAFYGAHPAATALLLEVWLGAAEERRRRSAVALAALDPDVPLVVVEAMAAWASAVPADDAKPAVPGALEGVARATAELLVRAIHSTDPQERARVAGLLASLCREAARISRRRVAA